MGAQVCNEQGSGYLTCDCGGGSGGASAEGGTDSPSSGGSKPDAMPTEAAQSDSLLSTDAALDASDESTSSRDDACSTTVPTIVNCSTSCDNQQVCPPARCEDMAPMVVSLPAGWKSPSVLRTPSGAMPDSYCPGCTGAIYKLVIHSQQPMRISVEPPWILGASSGGPCGLSATQCANFVTDVAVLTHESNAPVRNVTIRYANPQIPCP